MYTVINIKFKYIKFKIFDLFFQVLSQLLRKSKQKNLVIPNVKQAGSEQGTYEGATVSLFSNYLPL